MRATLRRARSDPGWCLCLRSSCTPPAMRRMAPGAASCHLISFVGVDVQHHILSLVEAGTEMAGVGQV
jgi:hypothetical protein